MGHIAKSRLAILLAISILASLAGGGLSFITNAATLYRVGAFPLYSQEGSTIIIVLTVSGITPSSVQVPYEFIFLVQDPSTQIWVSNSLQYTLNPGQTEFTVIILYPGPDFPNGASTSLVGVYHVQVNQVKPTTQNNVASTVFYVGLTDKAVPYQRTETVSIVATGYAANEFPVTITIRTATSLAVVHTAIVAASGTGQVTDSWKIPKNATTTESYIVTVQGTVTNKSPADAQGFYVNAAIMTISSLTPSQTIYQRTQTMKFSFQAVYPSGEIASTGSALVSLTSPINGTVTLTTSYDNTTQTFVAKYNTTPTNQTGTWTATLAGYIFDDGYGNTGPDTALTSSPQLQAATLSIQVTIKNSFAVNEQIRFNATIQYPDGTIFQSGQVSSFLTYSGGGYNYSIPVFFDSGLGLWEGAYSPSGAPGGLWSLRVSASDSPIPPNSGSTTRTITLADRPPTASFTVSSNTVQTGVLVTFNGTGSSDPDGTIVTWSWDFGDSSTGSGGVITHSYGRAGTFTVKLNVTDNSGSTAATTALMTIQDRPPVVSFTMSATSPAAGDSVSFSASGTLDPDGTLTAYAWDFGDGTTGSGLTATHTYNSLGSYTVTLTVTDNDMSTATSSSPITVTAASSTPNGISSVPLFWFVVLAGIIAAMFGGGMMYFRRHRVTHAKLKIDLEAVKTEAGRIENQEFFQSVKDQLKKDKGGTE